MLGSQVFGGTVFGGDDADVTPTRHTIPAGNPRSRPRRIRGRSPFAHVTIIGDESKIERVRAARVLIFPYPISKKKPLMHPTISAGAGLLVAPLPKAIIGTFKLKRAELSAGASFAVPRVGTQRTPLLADRVDVRAVQNPTDDELIAVFLASKR